MSESRLVALKYVARVNARTLGDSLASDTDLSYADLAAVDLDSGTIAPRLTTFDEAPSRARRLASAGDTLIPYLVGRNWQSTRPMLVDDAAARHVFSTGFYSVSPSAVVDPRYLNYSISAKTSLATLETEAEGVTMVGFTPAALGSVSVRLISIDQQRAIADYLDTETARIDALIERKKRMVELLVERGAALVEQCVRALCEAHGTAPLKHRTSAVQVGIVVTPAAWYAEHGVIALRGVNVSPGEISLEDVVRLSDKGHALNRKSVLRSGDLVVVRTGQAGAAAVVPAELDGSNCIDLLIVRPGLESVPRFLEYVLNSDWTQKHIAEHSVGSIQGHFNVGALKELPIPMAPVAVQVESVANLDLFTCKLGIASKRLTEQIDLLQERRQALITAAVTGELEVPGVAA